MNNVNLFIEKPLRKMTDHIDHFLKDWKVIVVVAVIDDGDG